MERGVRCFSVGESIPPSDSRAPSLSRVNRRVVPCGTGASIHLRGPVLHDVRFAAGGPWNCGDVAAQAPKGGPESLVRGIRELETGYENAIREVLLSFRIHAARYPSSTDISGLDHEVPVAVDIDRSGGCAERCGALGRIA